MSFGNLSNTEDARASRVRRKFSAIYEGLNPATLHADVLA